MSRSILGINILHDSVSMVVLNSGLKTTSIETHEYVISSGDQEMEDMVADALGIISEKQELDGVDCLIALPADRISIRNLQVPFSEPRKIRQVLPFEMESSLPSPTDDILIDFLTIPKTAPAQLIAAATEKTILHSLIAVFNQFNLEPAVVTVGGLATVLTLTTGDAVSGDNIVIDVAQRQSTVFFATSGGILMIRNLQNTNGPDGDFRYLKTGIDNMLFSFENLFDREFQPGQAFLTGIGLESTVVDASISDALDLPVRRIDLIDTTDIQFSDGSSQHWVPHLKDNALALALLEAKRIDSLNFRQGPYAVKHRWQINRKSVITTGILAGIALLLLITNVLIDNYRLNKAVDRYDQQIESIFKSAFPDITRIVDPVHQMRVNIDELKNQAMLGGNELQALRKIDIINNISLRVPSNLDVVFNRMVISQQNVTISGMTDTFNSVDEMKAKLESDSMFRAVTITSAQVDRSGNRVRFKLRIDL